MVSKVKTISYHDVQTEFVRKKVEKWRRKYVRIQQSTAKPHHCHFYHTYLYLKSNLTKLMIEISDLSSIDNW